MKTGQSERIYGLMEGLMNNLSEARNEIETIRDFLERCHKVEIDGPILWKDLTPAQKEFFAFYSQLAESEGLPLEKVVHQYSTIVKDYFEQLVICLQQACNSKLWRDKLSYLHSAADLTEEFVAKGWKFTPPRSKAVLKNTAYAFLKGNEKSEGRFFWLEALQVDFLILIESLACGKNLFALYEDFVQRFSGALLTALKRDRDPFASKVFVNDNQLRAIAYSLDALAPGFYIWFRGFRLRIGGSMPDDEPYYYPGVIRSNSGIAIVLGYHILSTYRGSHDPREA